MNQNSGRTAFTSRFISTVSASKHHTPQLIYSETDDNWSGQAFYIDFDLTDAVVINRSAEIIPSQYTTESVYFEPPLTAVGYSGSDQIN